MRNLKKFLALVLAMLMIVSAAATVSAFSDVAEDNAYAAAINDLVEKKIINGVGDDKFDPDGSVTRWQMALMIARALTADDTIDWSKGTQLFTDIDQWYGAINYAYSKGIVTGVGNNKFEPNEGIKYHDALLMALRALGYTVDVSGDPYYLAGFFKAEELGLTANVDIEKADKELTRAETAQVLYNMLGADRANSELTFAEELYGEAGVKNVTTYVITATGKQAYTGSSEVLVDGDYVTLQALNADGTLGDGFYVEFDKLEFDEDVKSDDVIGYSVGLVNLDGTDFASAIPGTATVYTQNDVTADGGKITIGGRVYYLVDEYTDSTIKNEIIVKRDDGVISSNSLSTPSDLYFNKEGNVVDKNGKVLAVKQNVVSYNGQTLYALASEVGKDAFLLYTASELIRVPAIVTAYVDILSITGYADIESIDKNSAFVLTVFNDGTNTKHARATLTPVYMSVKDGVKDNKDQTVGPMNGQGGVTYTKDLKKGDLFTYTYNKQTKVVNVIDVLGVEYGTVERINRTSGKDAEVTVKISGETYKFASTASAKAFGATIKPTASVANSMGDIANAKFQAMTVQDFFVDKKATVGSTVKFYAYNGYLIYADTYNVEENFNLITVKSINDFSSKAVIADIYFDGKLIKDAEISEYINAVGKSVKFADLSTVAYSRAMNEFLYYEGGIFKGIKLEDGSFRLGVYLYDADAKTPLNTDITKPVNEGGFGYTKYIADADATSVNFFDNVSEGNRKFRIRTTDDTVFYFIKGGNVTVAVTAAKDSTITLDGNTEIYADKLGYSETFKGIAKVVIVKDYKDIDGFGIKAQANATVFVPNGIALDNAEVATAADLGLTGYTGVFYKYTGIAIDMSNGAVKTIYSSKKLTETGVAYKIDANDVVLDGSKIDLSNTDVFASKPITKGDVHFDDDMYAEITGVFGQDAKVSTIYMQLENQNKIDRKAGGDAAKLVGEYGATVYYLKNDLKDGIFVGILDPNQKPDEGPKPVEDKGTYYYYGNQKFIATVTGMKDGKLENLVVTIYREDRLTKVPFTGAIVDGTQTGVSLKKAGSNDNILAAGSIANATVNADGSATVEVGTITWDGFNATTLEAGKYQLTVVFKNAGTDNVQRTLVYEFEIK